MSSLKETASNKPLTKEESLEWCKGAVSRPTCTCLREIETGVPRTMFCFVPCEEQRQILEARKKLMSHD